MSTIAASSGVTVDELVAAINTVTKMGYDPKMVQSNLHEYIANFLTEEIKFLDGTSERVDYLDYLNLREHFNINRIRDKEHLKDLLMVIAL